MTGWSSTLVGTGGMIRLGLRRDRLRLPIWLFVLLTLLGGQIAGIDNAYPDRADRIAYATVMSSSPAARAFGAPDGISLGAITMNEIYATLAVLAAIMSFMGVVRHTRQNEESGRLELVGATVVGRHAGLAAALVLAAGSMAAFAGCALVELLVIGLPTAGAACMVLAIAGTGLVFAAAGAVTSQVASTARAANGIAGIVLGMSFLLLSTGSVLGSTRSDGLGVVLAWPAWLSPLAWGDLTYPFTQARWWALLPYLATTALLIGAAGAIAARRDLGQGLLAVRPGRATARRSLSSPLGLAVRLQRAAWFWWAVSSAVIGATTGVFTDEFEAMLEGNEQAQALFAAMGSDSLRDNALALMMGTIGIMLVAYMVQAVLRLRTEEGRALESVLATATGRVRWMASHVLVAVVGSTLLLLIAGFSAGLAAMLVTGDRSLVSDLVLAAAVQIPAVLLTGAVGIVAFGASVRAAPYAGWGAFSLCLFTLVADLFRVPDWILELSPFAHVPLVPAEPFSGTPLALMLAGAMALSVVGALLLRRRDIA